MNALWSYSLKHDTMLPLTQEVAHQLDIFMRGKGKGKGWGGMGGKKEEKHSPEFARIERVHAYV